jgi:hypothetical protein
MEFSDTTRPRARLDPRAGPMHDDGSARARARDWISPRLNFAFSKNARAREARLFGSVCAGVDLHRRDTRDTSKERARVPGGHVDQEQRNARRCHA